MKTVGRRHSLPGLAEEEQLDARAALSGGDGDAQAGRVVFLRRHDSAVLPDEKKAVLRRGDDGQAEAALRVRDGGRRPAGVFSAGQRLNLYPGDGTAVSLGHAPFDDRTLVGRERERSRRRPRRRGAGAADNRKEAVSYFEDPSATSHPTPRRVASSVTHRAL